MSPRQGYDHVQQGRLHWLVYGGAAVCLWAGIVILDGAAPGERTAGFWLYFVLAGLLGVLGMSFQYMRVRDRGEVMEINFGPLPLLRRQVRYDEIVSVKRGRTAWIDGWGIHLVPGRGWTWNVWGRDCAELQVNGSRLRVGTNDPDGLVAMIEERLADRADGPGSPGQVVAVSSK